jgi:hypothetical protein
VPLKIFGIAALSLLMPTLGKLDHFFEVDFSFSQGKNNLGC